MYNSKIKNLTEYRLKATGRVGLPAPQVSSLPGASKLKLLDQVRQAIRTRHYSYLTEKAYVHWVKRFIFFHRKRHPAEMSEAEIAGFPSSLATDRHVSASTQRLMIELFFHNARDTLFELLQDDRHLGGLPGVMICLHTWGRILSLHPHVHCLVTGGGLTPRGEWKSDCVPCPAAPTVGQRAQEPGSAD